MLKSRGGNRFGLKRRVCQPLGEVLIPAEKMGRVHARETSGTTWTTALQWEHTRTPTETSSKQKSMAKNSEHVVKVITKNTQRSASCTQAVHHTLRERVNFTASCTSPNCTHRKKATRKDATRSMCHWGKQFHRTVCRHHAHGNAPLWSLGYTKGDERKSHVWQSVHDQAQESEAKVCLPPSRRQKHSAIVQAFRKRVLGVVSRAGG